MALPDGGVLLCELMAGTLTCVGPRGDRRVVAELGGSPNGAAIGPDGRIYVCNSGGFDAVYCTPDNRFVPPGTPGAICVTTNQPESYSGGSIQRVDFATGHVETLYTTFQGQIDGESHLLRGPDDLVFDAHGGFWMSDFGKSRPRERDITGLYYALADGSSIREAVFPVNAPNGIALSPDGSRLYVAETYTRMLLYWDLKDPGQIAPTGRAFNQGHLLTCEFPGQSILDSIKVDADGNIYVATMLPDGNVVGSNGGLTVVSPAGKVLEYIPLAVEGAFDPLPSNLCFGGPDRRTAFITLGGSGTLVSCRMSVPGLEPAYELAGP